MHLITLLELGGAQLNTLYTVKALDRKRFEVALIAGKGGYLDAEALALPETRVALLDELVRPVNPWKDVRALLRVKRILKAFVEPGRDLIVHTHSGKAGVVGRAAAKMAGIRAVVHHIHNLSYPKLKGGRFAWVGRRIEGLVDPWTQGFISVCHANLREGSAIGLYRSRMNEVIRSGFDTKSFRECRVSREEARQRFGLAIDAPAAGLIACFKPQKNPLAFIRICAAVAREEPDTVFPIAGDGALRPDIERAVREHGLEDKVKLLGWRRDIPELLRAMDVLVLTSLWEGLPRVIPQAFLSGIPVVASAVDGVPEVVRDRENGYLVPPFDETTATRRVLDIIRSKGKCLDPGPDPSEFAERFDQDKMVRRQEAFYLRLLDSVNPGKRKVPCDP